MISISSVGLWFFFNVGGNIKVAEFTTPYNETFEEAEYGVDPAQNMPQMYGAQ